MTTTTHRPYRLANAVLHTLAGGIARDRVIHYGVPRVAVLMLEVCISDMRPLTTRTLRENYIPTLAALAELITEWYDL